MHDFNMSHWVHETIDKKRETESLKRHHSPCGSVNCLWFKEQEANVKSTVIFWKMFSIRVRSPDVKKKTCTCIQHCVKVVGSI